MVEKAPRELASDGANMASGNPNPFRPGFNQQPPEIAGREQVCRELAEAVEVAASGEWMPRPVVLVGTRGVGKTVLLEYTAQLGAQRYGCTRIHVEVTPGTDFATALSDAARDAQSVVDEGGKDRRLHLDELRLRAGVAGIGAEAKLAPAEATRETTQRQLRQELMKLLARVAANKSALIVTIDEAHQLTSRTLSPFAALMQEGAGAGWPAVFVLAGLPLMYDPGHTVTYLERAAWRELHLLTQAETLHALQPPAERSGKPMRRDAAELLARASGGYPYAIQVYGYHAFDAARQKRAIDIDAAHEGRQRGDAELEQSLYRHRWNAASPLQRAYLQATAALEADARPALSGDIAKSLGRTAQQLSSTRERLRDQGLIVTTRAEVRLAIPGMAAYVAQQPPAIDAVRRRSPRSEPESGSPSA